MHYISSKLKNRLEQRSQFWLVTGGAGFIGSHIAEQLIKAGQKVRVLDDLSTGCIENIQQLESLGKAGTQGRDDGGVEFIKGSITDTNLCYQAVKGVDIIIHEAAIGSVPHSFSHPLEAHEVNATGHLNLLWAAKEHRVKRFVYASSSAVYGNNPDLPKQEGQIGDPLSPYAVTKRVNELYSQVFNAHFGIETVGLRYFNVFGPRQTAKSVYAAVIPLWINGILNNQQNIIYGSGETSRDFAFIANVVEATILAGLVQSPQLYGSVVNIGLEGKISLLELHEMIAVAYRQLVPGGKVLPPLKENFRAGDILHSQASISKARDLLGFESIFSVEEGILETVKWFLEHQS